MKNRILAAGIFILPVSLFVYFWCYPVAERKPSSLETPLVPAAATANAIGQQKSNASGIITSNTTRLQPVPAGQPSPFQFTNFSR